MKAGEVVGDIPLPPLADGMAVTARGGGHLLVGQRLRSDGRQDDPGPQGQRLRRRTGAGQGVEGMALVGGQHHRGGKRMFVLGPCRALRERVAGAVMTLNTYAHFMPGEVDPVV